MRLEDSPANHKPAGRGLAVRLGAPRACLKAATRKYGNRIRKKSGKDDTFIVDLRLTERAREDACVPSDDGAGMPWDPCNADV